MNFQMEKDEFHYSYDEFEFGQMDFETETITRITYHFRNHFHPFVGNLIEQLNRKSLAGLFDVRFQGTLVEAFFKDEYGPKEGDSSVAVVYPDKEIDLSVGGPYSVYNWELFFHVPLTIAVHLGKNQRFAQAQKWFHFIFDPTSNDQSVDPPMRFWKFRQFRERTDTELINDMLTLLSQPEENALKEQIMKSIEGWRRNPFQPHLIARTRFLAYQFHVVMKYLDNLIAWGDSLFRQDTIETINEATQLYVLAANILGPRPQQIPRPGKIRPRTFADLRGKLDAFSNALVEMETQFPFNQGIPGSEPTGTSPIFSLFGITRTLYFCIPPNDKLLGYWDTVADRLFKIRHCMNIEGIVRQLPLFQPPIDPGMLVKAAAAGIDVSSVVSGLNQPPSPVRAPLIIQKALELAGEVKSLGSGLLSALEKKDAESLTILRQGHEIKILQLVEDLKYLQWKETEAATEGLLKSRQTVFQRYRHFQRLLGKKEEDLGDIRDIAVERKELTEDNFDEIYDEWVGRYAAPLTLEAYRQGGGESGSHTGADEAANLRLNRSENDELNVHMPDAHNLQQSSGIVDLIASVFSLIPQFDVHGTPIGVGVATGFGGRQLADFTSLIARIIRLAADSKNYEALRASKLAVYERRIEDWILQNNQAAGELMQIGRQLIASLIREQITRREYENQKDQIRQAREIDEFLKEKFTRRDFYTWLQAEISRIYYECYQFAFDVAMKAEQTMKNDLMRPELDDLNFIKFNYWDNGRKGLLSGEALYLDLKRLEMAYHDHHKREYEMTKDISLQQLRPEALLQLKATGSCEITVPEWFFDMGCPGHYMRRIKTVSLSIPCVTGPYAGINCTLSLLKSTIRRSPLLKEDEYRRLGSEDNRFIDYYGTIQSIVTSHASHDSGLFETNLRDERYLPFEGAGAVSTWRLELPADYKQFDYDTISDVIIHLRYTARQGGALLKSRAGDRVIEIVNEAGTAGLARAFSLKHEFPTEWHRFITSEEDLRLTVKKDHFPYLAQGKTIQFHQADLFALPSGSLNGRSLAAGYLDTLNSGFDSALQSDIVIAADPEVLRRDRDEPVFLVLGYTLR